MHLMLRRGFRLMTKTVEINNEKNSVKKRIGIFYLTG